MKMFMILGLCLTIFSVSALNITFSNSDIKIADHFNYSKIDIKDPVYDSSHPGSPAIPLRSVFFEIPLDQKILDVEITSLNIKQHYLTSDLIPVQQPYPLIQSEKVELTDPEEDSYNKSKYPFNLLYDFGQNMCGDRKIGFVSFFCGYYYPQDLKLEIPGTIELEIEFIEDETEFLPPGIVSNTILNKLGIQTEVRQQEPIHYLLITTSEFEPYYEPLLNWRRAQGIQVNSVTVEDIGSQYTGRDLQEMIRNCILEYYVDQGVSYVTLGGDVDHIPDRKVFAFDCEFGAYDDENDIPCDMYYSCLNGNWDANGNGIFGEDLDETDHFPEVYIGRIPVNTLQEIEDYINRLILYESGEIEDYNKAGGFSMELWTGANSEICQQYIYDMYFPEYYSIQFNFDEENTQENAYLIMNENQNIIQHTGHSGKQSMSLEDGRIRVDELDALNNDWGGIFYSIGCWSAAIDYNSIGENLVSQIDKGFLGYVGNSRYGWGAPSAPGFGFSEFYQKEFFKELFNDHTKLAEINALQKVPFIPYFNGVSVYKWVAYELNALGDSYFNMNINNPQIMNYSVMLENNEYQLYISSGTDPLENVSVYCSGILVHTDITGQAIVPLEYAEDPVSLYKSGYKAEIIDLQNLYPSLYLEISDLPENLNLAQGEGLSFTTRLHNNLEQDQEFLVEYEYNPDEIQVEITENPGFISAGASLELAEVTIEVKLITESYQMRDGKSIFYNQKIISLNNYEVLAERALELTILAPELAIPDVFLNAQIITPGIDIPILLSILNQGSSSALGLDIEFYSPSPYITFESDEIQIDACIESGNEMSLVNSLNIIENAPEDILDELIISVHTTSEGQDYSFERSVYLTSGRINFYDDFSDNESWDLDQEWQLVDNCFHSQYSALSCRPDYVGNFRAGSPVLSYLPGMELSFFYKYKMPMYGEDGVYLLLETAEWSDTLLFLGAGGALPVQNRDPLVYIESDWGEYSIDLADVLQQQPLPGTPFWISLEFTFPELIEGFNEYGNMDEIGVFFDDLKIGIENIVQENETDHILIIYPNPSRKNNPPRFSVNLNERKVCEVEIFNIKGQRVKRLLYRNLDEGPVTLYWNGKDEENNDAASGVYYILIDTGKKKTTGKFVYLN